MKYIPLKIKYKKQFKGKTFTNIFKNTLPFNLLTGSIGLKAIENGLLTSKNFESLRQSIKKILKKTGFIKFIGFPQTPKTKKPLEIRMGKGKGNVDHWVYKVQPGAMLCEIHTIYLSTALKALRNAQFKLPIKTKIIKDK